LHVEVTTIVSGVSVVVWGIYEVRMSNIVVWERVYVTRTDNYFSTNTGADGMVYFNRSEHPSFRHDETAPSPFQRNHLNIGRKFVLNTADGSSKGDLSLTLAGMPKPFAFVTGKYKIDGVVLPAPDQ
jgi:hypothetical protein